MRPGFLRDDRGSLPFAMLVAMVTILTSAMLGTTLAWQARSADREQAIQDARWAADSAISLAMERMSLTNRALRGVPVAYQVPATSAQGPAWRTTAQETTQMRWFVVPGTSTNDILLIAQGRTRDRVPLVYTTVVDMNFNPLSGQWSATRVSSDFKEETGEGITPGSPPGPPENVAVTVNSNSATLTWDPPSNPGGSPLKDYVIEYAPMRTGATGGDAIYNVQVSGSEYTVHEFRETGTSLFVPDRPLAVEYLIVGGGGGGGGVIGGGGGAGGVITNVGGTPLMISTKQSITVGVGGAGGNGYDSDQQNGKPGQPSSAFGYTALGGGGGRHYGSKTSATTVNGASGGGGAYGGSAGGLALQPGSSSGGLGNAGGGGGDTNRGAGGGGAGAAGGNTVTGGGGNGGAGISSLITGGERFYAGGGGGGLRSSAANQPGVGGVGGGGSGTKSTIRASSGTPNTGSGGGGGGYNTTFPSEYIGGDGGSGIVIVRYPQVIEGWTALSDGLSTEREETISGLEPNVRYMFRVAAVNEYGPGQFSDPLFMKPFPAAPPDVVATAGNSEVGLTWAETPLGVGGPIVDYELQYRTSATYPGETNILHRQLPKWNLGAGMLTGWPLYGTTAENDRVEAADPWGRTEIVWRSPGNDVGVGDDGGWRTNRFEIDPSKTYRFSVWVKREIVGNGRAYFGLFGYNAANGNAGVLSRATGTNNTNPYFWNALLPDTQWRLVVGHVFPVGSGTGSLHPDSGTYLLTGAKSTSSTVDYVWQSVNTTALHRVLLYDSTDTSTVQIWAHPRVDVLDGNEPSLQELLQGAPAGAWTPFNDGISASRSAVVDGLTNGKAYDFRIAGRSQEGTGQFSEDSYARPRVSP